MTELHDSAVPAHAEALSPAKQLADAQSVAKLYEQQNKLLTAECASLRRGVTELGEQLRRAREGYAADEISELVRMWAYAPERGYSVEVETSDEPTAGRPALRVTVSAWVPDRFESTTVEQIVTGIVGHHEITSDEQPTWALILTVGEDEEHPAFDSLREWLAETLPGSIWYGDETVVRRARS